MSIDHDIMRDAADILAAEFSTPVEHQANPPPPRKELT